MSTHECLKQDKRKKDEWSTQLLERIMRVAELLAKRSIQASPDEQSQHAEKTQSPQSAVK